VVAEELIVGDAREVEFADRESRFSAIVTDTPYGRSSSTGKTTAKELVEEVTARWAERSTPDGRLLAILPAGDEPAEVPGTLRYRIPVRVHRSLTREFRLYEHSRSTQSSL